MDTLERNPDGTPKGYPCCDRVFPDPDQHRFRRGPALGLGGGLMTARQQPTRRQLEILRAYIAAGSGAAAAYELGISDTTVRQHLSGLDRRIDCLNAAQAACWLGRSVAVDPPAGRLKRIPSTRIPSGP